MLRALDQVLRSIVTVGVAISAGLILIAAVVITIDVLSTVGLNSPIPVVTELASASLAVIIFAALAYAQYRQQNVKVDILLAFLPAAARRILHGFSLLIGAALFCLIAWRTVALAITSWGSAETAMALIPFSVYPFKIAAAIGAVAAAAEFIRQFVCLLLGHDQPDRPVELPAAAKL